MTKNVAASVRARLANQAKETQRPFQEVLQYYGLERWFVMRDLHRPNELGLLQSRNALCWLKGPMTRGDLRRLGPAAAHPTKEAVRSEPGDRHSRTR